MRYVLTAALACAMLWSALAVRAQQQGPAKPKDPLKAQWIWFDEGHPLEKAPAGKVWFRYEAKVGQPSTGIIRVLCDDHFVVWVNGHRLGEGSADKPYRFNLSGLVDAGTNVIAVEADNRDGRAGLFVTGGIRLQGSGGGTVSSTTVNIGTSGKWSCTREAPQGDAWLTRAFDAQAWKPAKVLAPHAESPWKDIVFTESLLDRYDLAPGFVIERIGEPELVGSLVCMTWGNRGRLIASRERGPIIAASDSNNDGVFDKVVEYTKQVQNCQGLCMVFDDLYAVGQGPNGVGIYRLPDRNGDDQADEVQLVQHLNARMAEHGPHDVVYGPDGWLYYNHGNIPDGSKIGEFHFTDMQPTSPINHWYEGNLLEPAFEDPRGHSVGNKAPAGSIYRFSPEGKHWFFEVCGFRNQYDFAFNSLGDMFSYDSDMEWDVGVPWYRPTRVSHCPPGADFGWHSGAKNWPAYYFDSLPATVDIGRGSPTGVVFYEHTQLPEKYRGSLLICDWSLGRMMAVHLKPEGATFAGTTETLATGNPLNVSDIEIDRDGSIVFVTGGRNSEGGVYRIRYQGTDAKPPRPLAEITDPLDVPQLQSGWAREKLAGLKKSMGDEKWKAHLDAALAGNDAAKRAKALVLLSQYGPKPDRALLQKLSGDSDASVRGLSLWLLGELPGDASTIPTLTKALDDANPMVQRRACEAFIHAGLEAPVEPLLKLMASDDRFLSFLARLALERVPAEKWRSSIYAAANEEIVRPRTAHLGLRGLLALYRLPGQFDPEAALKLELAMLTRPGEPMGEAFHLEMLRMIQLTIIAAGKSPVADEIGKLLIASYPSGHVQTDMEVARLIAWLQVPGSTQKLVEQLETAKTQEMQIHLALCLAYSKEGWNADLQQRLLMWYEKTKRWEGGASFGPYLVNIVSETLKPLTPDERRALLVQWSEHPFSARLIVEMSTPEQISDFVDTVNRLFTEVSAAPASPLRDDLLDTTVTLLGKSKDAGVQALLRKLYDSQPDRRSDLVRMLASTPTQENWPYLLKTLQSTDSTTAQICLAALAKIKLSSDLKPSAADYRAVILSGLTLGEGGGKLAVRVLNLWTGKKPVDNQRSSEALAGYQQWFREQYPNEPAPVPPVVKDPGIVQQMKQLVDFLDSAPGKEGDAERGKQIFTKANCIKCHQFKIEGQGIGPDLTTVRRRFRRPEIVESLMLPSKIISDQYRAKIVGTTDGLTYMGLELKQSDPTKLVLMLPDTKKVEIPVQDIDPEQTAPSQISVMPEGLLKELSLEEIADLFAFLETSKDNEETPKK